MDCVLDASLVVSWCIPDEQHDGSTAPAVQALLMGATTHAPEIFPVEVRNALMSAERRKRVKPAEVDQFLTRLGRMATRTYPVAAYLDTSVALSRRYQLSVYDALYIALAARLGLPLATLDTQQSLAARSEGVALLLS